MSVPPLPAAPYYRPYSPTSTDASWKAAKTDKIRDKWNTELGAALRAAKTAYDKIKFERMDVGLWLQQHGQWQVAADVDVAKVAAQKHFQVVVKPAIKALETAKSKADWAARNLVVTKQVNDKARLIAGDLGMRLRQLKAIRFDDYDNEKARLERNFQFAFDSFGAGMTNVLRKANVFINAVVRAPTPAKFNAGIQTAARDITQQLANVERLRKNGHDLGKPNPAQLVAGLEDWAEGRDTLDDDATRAEVLQAIRAYRDAVQDVRDWWA